ncbi:hypothetical protein [Rhizobium leguminosarum]|uniref:hypothetical protein n=1 Tax=Rhizobium leguminosarum TaxID=384 RepID=UPI001AE4132C|nr:hypothetical protein [Rhizobium leguminosarum]MBP2449792.1 hypothetical protein [Rhizobium leguminosarum]
MALSAAEGTVHQATDRAVVFLPAVDGMVFQTIMRGKEIYARISPADGGKRAVSN